MPVADRRVNNAGVPHVTEMDGARHEVWTETSRICRSRMCNGNVTNMWVTDLQGCWCFGRCVGDGARLLKGSLLQLGGGGGLRRACLLCAGRGCLGRQVSMNFVGAKDAAETVYRFLVIALLLSNFRARIVVHRSGQNSGSRQSPIPDGYSN